MSAGPTAGPPQLNDHHTAHTYSLPHNKTACPCVSLSPHIAFTPAVSGGQAPLQRGPLVLGALRVKLQVLGQAHLHTAGRDSGGRRGRFQAHLQLLDPSANPMTATFSLSMTLQLPAALRSSLRLLSWSITTSHHTTFHRITSHCTTTRHAPAPSSTRAVPSRSAS